MEHINKLIKVSRLEDPDLYRFTLEISATIPRRKAQTKHEEQRNHRDFADAQTALRQRITGPIIEEVLRTKDAVMDECTTPLPRLSVIQKAFSELLQTLEPKEIL